MDVGLLSRELVRAARGGLTQKQLSALLGYRSNVLFAWEGGRDYPQVTDFFRLLRVSGRDPGQLARLRADLGPVNPEDYCQLSAWLQGVRGDAPLAPLVERTGRDRFALSRFFRGKSEPRLPDFLALLEALNVSALDFIALFVDPLDLPSARSRWQSLEIARRSAYEFPWAHAIVALCRLPAYQALARHEPGWFASRLGQALRALLGRRARR